MKKILSLLMVLCVTQAITTECIVELAKLGIDVATLGADVSASKIIAAAIAAAKTYKEVQKVLSVCGTGQQPQIANEKILIQEKENLTPECIVELAKLGIDVAILGADVSASKIIAAAIAAAKTYKEVQKVLSVCGTGQQPQLINEQILIEEKENEIEQLALTPECIVELAKLGIDVATLGVDVSASKIIAAAIAAAKTYKEVQKVISVCGTGQDISQFKNHINEQALIQYNEVDLEFPFKECWNKGTKFMIDAKNALDKIKAGQKILDNQFVDQLVSLVKEVDTVLIACQLNGIESKWINILPNDCVEDLGVVAHDVKKLMSDKGHTATEVRDLLRLENDYNIAQDNCPFLKHL